jgi:hypothetical protein
VVEHGRVRCHLHRVHVRQRRGSGRKLDALGRVNEGRLEQHAVGDVLRLVGKVLADERVVKAESVGEDDRLPVLLQGLGEVAVKRMDGHCKIAEAHGISGMRADG